ncbi:MAG TPA: GIY-YIG nuclease family protein [Candidatus Binatia bacterium]|nr:GIY-YIG nuclease family protein [Candidatus Binatia bacterium]
MSTEPILPQPPHSKPTVYVLACRDGSLYTGATLDLPRRLTAHRRGGAKYTRGRLPVTLVACWHPATFAAAKSQEARFKRLRRAEKLALLGAGEAYGCCLHRCPDGNLS